LRLTAALAVMALAASSWADAAIVYSVTAKPVNGELTSINAQGEVVLTIDGKKSAIPMQQIYRIELQKRSADNAAQAPAEVYTTDGSRLFGTPAKSDQAFGVGVKALGRTVHFQVNTLLAIRFQRSKELELSEERFEEALAKENRGADLLFVSTDKGANVFEVAISRVGPKRTAFHWDGEDREIDTSRVSAIVFANRRAEAPSPAVVRLIDDSILCGTIKALDKKALSITVSDMKLSLPLVTIAAIELANPDVIFLADLRPEKVEEIPFFNHIWSHRINRSIGGGPLTLDGITYDSGIGCHTKTVLSYDLERGFKRFAAVIGIDDAARPRGSVTFIIEADGKGLFSRTLTGLDRAVSVELDITGVSHLTLTTDFNEDASVGDHANWADARLIK
jgi:hypothetical protein